MSQFEKFRSKCVMSYYVAKNSDMVDITSKLLFEQFKVNFYSLLYFNS